MRKFLLVATMLAVGCTAGVEGDAPSADDSASEGVSEAPGEVTVEARNINFVPDGVTVAAGGTVTFTNEDIVNHTVTSGLAGEPDGMFDLALPSGDETVSFTFEEPGVYDIYCDLHRTMTMQVEVLDS